MPREKRGTHQGTLGWVWHVAARDQAAAMAASNDAESGWKTTVCQQSQRLDLLRTTKATRSLCRKL